MSPHPRDYRVKATLVRLRISRDFLVVFISCTLVYYLVFARLYISGIIVHGSDTHGMWTAPYLAFFSIQRWGEFPWWDPTTANGWPIYNVLLNWTYNYFSPYALPYLLGFKVFTLFQRIGPEGINTAIVIQKTLYYFVINLVAVMLLSRELLRDRVARLLPPIVFTLSVIQFQGFRDSHQFEALPGPLFYIFALLLLNRRRDVKSLFIFILFTGLYLASASYAITQSALYWTALFTVFVVLFDATLLRAISRLTAGAWASVHTRALLLLGAVLLPTALAAPVTSVLTTLGHLLRGSNGGPIAYDMPLFGDWEPPFFGIPSHEVWTSYMFFAPFSELYDAGFKFGPSAASGVDHRYVGLAVVPLLTIALIVGARRRYVYEFFLTFVVSVMFLMYGPKNLAVLSLVQLPFFQNGRTVSYFIPRDGGALCLIFVAAMGFDYLMSGRWAENGPVVPRGRGWNRESGLMLALLFLMLTMAALSVGLAIDPTWGKLRHTLAHVGIYLGLFSMLCITLLITSERSARRKIAVVFFVLVVTDLTVSSSHYFSERPGYMVFRNENVWQKPAPRAIGPVMQESDLWTGGYGNGVMHNPAGPYPIIALREWMVLATHARTAPLIENWNMQTLRMKAYPHFRFFTNGRFIPFETIRSIDTVPVPRSPGAWFYLHDEQLMRTRPEPGVPLDGNARVVSFSLNRVRVSVTMPRPGFMVFYDNYSPYWSARVDGTATPIHRANFALKAIELTPGAHLVEWTFSPSPAKVAWALFYGVFGAYAVGAWWVFRAIGRTGAIGAPL